MLHFFVKEDFTSSFEPGNVPRLLYVSKVDHTSPQIPRAMHVHKDRVEIVLICEGNGNHTINNHKYQTKKGDVLFYNSGIIHDESATQGESMHTYCLGIQNLQIAGLDKNQLLPNAVCPVIHSGNSFKKIRRLFIMILSCVKNNEPNSTEVSNYLMRSLLVVLRGLILQNEVPLATSDYNLGLQIKEYIDEHYLEDINLNMIAEALYVNAYYLSHTFKKIIGYSPMQYVIRRRIGEAQTLLINTNHTITDIAMMSGYNNSNYFQMVFNTMVGMSPGKYRKSWMQDTKK